MLDQLATFTTVFLGIFMEAAPFLLLGSVASGLVEVFVSRAALLRLVPHSRFAAPLIGGLLGFAFPVCECGVVPLTRRLFRKGLPIPAGIAFLLAAPILNPVVLASTYAAYGWGRLLAARFVLGLLVAVIVGVIFSLHPQPLELLRPRAGTGSAGGAEQSAAAGSAVLFRTRLRRALRFAADDFFDMGRYLVIGSLLAALLQTLVPQTTLLAIGSGPVASVMVMQAVAFVLSVCSTVDAFVSLAFASTFSTGALLAFLVFGPMVDIKSTLMFLGVFTRKTVAYLIALPFLLTLLAGALINLLGW